MKNKSDALIEKLGIWKIFLLVICAAVSITGIYILISLTGILSNYPNIILFCIAGFIGGIGFQIGYIIYRAKTQHSSFNIFLVLGLQEEMKLKEFAIWIPTLIAITIALFLGTQFIGVWLQETFFSWLPDWYFLQADYSSYSNGVQTVTYALILIFIAVIIPIIEEIFFRGYLMPRMAWMGNWAVIVNITLFAFYHFWSPWMIITRIIALYPLYHVVYKKQSLKLAIYVHCSVNLLADFVYPIITSLQ